MRRDRFYAPKAFHRFLPRQLKRCEKSDRLRKSVGVVRHVDGRRTTADAVAGAFRVVAEFAVAVGAVVL